MSKGNTAHSIIFTFPIQNVNLVLISLTVEIAGLTAYRNRNGLGAPTESSTITILFQWNRGTNLQELLD